jgi:2-polyprenyl-3-methyl-5-hydroxy-6-metoxy-1,4-benzoquinol methylase
MDLERYKEVIGKDFSKDVEFINSILKSLDLDKNSRILDVGTGWGAMAILLALNGFHVLTGQPEDDPEWEEHREEGQDNEGEHVNHINFPDFDWRRNADRVGVVDLIEFQNLDAQDLDFPDGSFDGVFLYDALQHILDRKKALSECIRVVDESGLVCVIEWNKRTIEEDEKEYGHKILFVDPGKILIRDDIEIDLVEGEYVNVFLIRKK